MKDALGHGSNPRGVMAAHQAGIAGTIPNIVYHGTTHAFEGPPGIPPEDFMLDRMLGPHFAADPEVSTSFIMNRENDHDIGLKPGARMLTVELPDGEKFLEVPQPRYDWAVGNAEIKDWQARTTDQRAIEGMISHEGYRQDPAMLSRYLNQARAIPPEQAELMARDLAAGKTVHFPTEGRAYDLKSFVSNFGGRPYNGPDRQRIVDLARKSWQSQGYKGLRYVDTSPMEMARAKNSRAYVLFDPKDAKVRAVK